MHKFDDSILRAYDIRGVIGETLNANDAFALGRKFSLFIGNKNSAPKIVVGYDGRISSQLLNKELIRGLVSNGSEVTCIGMCPSPMLYYASEKLKSDGAIMITGSHNPANYNGFKMLVGGRSIFGKDIQKLARVEEGNIKKEGIKKNYNIEESYLSTLTKYVKNFNEELKVVWDPGNGATGDLLKKMITLLPGKHILINSKVDGTFPSHHPDPTEEKNLKQLKTNVARVHADIGIAFDGDGDRIGIIDSESKFIPGDKLLFIFATQVIKNHPAATIISDVKASNAILSEINKIGGKSLMWKTGHSFIKAKMKETGALLAGEMSGHIFFADKYYGFDDALYASIRLLDILSREKNLNKFLKRFSSLVSTPEIKIPCDDKKKFSLIQKVTIYAKKKYNNVNFIDGIRVDTKKGWWLLRASNTQPALVVRCEAKSKDDLSHLISDIKQILKSNNIDNNL